jgi:hypothetical protein
LDASEDQGRILPRARALRSRLGSIVYEVLENPLSLILVTASTSVVITFVLQEEIKKKIDILNFIAICLVIIFLMYILHNDFKTHQIKLVEELQNSFADWEPTIDIADISILSRFPTSPEIICGFTAAYREIFSSARKIKIWPIIRIFPPIFENNSTKYWKTNKELTISARGKKEGKIRMSLDQYSFGEYVINHKGVQFEDRDEIARGSKQELSLSLQLYLSEEIDDISPVYELEISPLDLIFPSKRAVFDRIVDAKCLKRLLPKSYPPFALQRPDRYSARYTNLFFHSKKFLDYLKNMNMDKKNDKAKTWGDIFKANWILEDITRLMVDEILRNEDLKDCCIAKLVEETDEINSLPLIKMITDKMEYSREEFKGKHELYIGIFQTEFMEDYIWSKRAKGLFLFGNTVTEDIKCIFNLNDMRLYKTCDLNEIINIEEEDKGFISQNFYRMDSVAKEGGKAKEEKKDLIGEEEQTKINKKISEREEKAKIIGEISDKEPYDGLKAFLLDFSEFIVQHGGFINSVPEFTDKWVNIHRFNRIVSIYKEGKWFKRLLESVIVNYIHCHKEKIFEYRKPTCGLLDFILINVCSESTDLSDKPLKILHDWKLKNEKLTVIEFFHEKNKWKTEEQLPEGKKAIIVASVDSHVRELVELVRFLRKNPYKIETCLIVPVFSLIDIRSRINRGIEPGEDTDIDVLPLFYIRNNDVILSRRICEIRRIGVQGS